jgi:hypothetical protein
MKAGFLLQYNKKSKPVSRILSSISQCSIIYLALSSLKGSIGLPPGIERAALYPDM